MLTHKRGKWFAYADSIFGDIFVWPGHGSGGTVTPPVVVPPTEDGPHGPGWNITHPHGFKRKRDTRLERIEESLLRAFDKVEDADSKKQRVEAVKDLKREIVAVVETQTGDDEQFAALAEAFRQAQFVQLSLQAYIEKVGSIIEEWRLNWLAQDRDDLEAAMLMMELL